MKVKGINPLEQNVEKIVLGVAGLALVGVVAMQLLGDSTVEVKSGQRVPLDRAYQPVKDEANAVLAQMTEAEPDLPEVPVIDLMGQYTEQATRPVAVRPRIVALGPPTPIAGSGDLEDPASFTDAVYAAVQVPPPAPPAGYAFRSTIDPRQVARSPELAAIVPVAQPHDVAAITIETTFDGLAMQEALRADPDGAAGPQRPMPLRWWQDGMEIIAVRAERQALQPDGSWSEPEPVRPVPGSIDLLTPPEPEERYNPVTLRTAVSTARQEAAQILRPRYLNVIAGRPWVPPSAHEGVAAIEASRADIDRLRNQRREMEREIRRQEALLEREGGGSGGNRPAPGGGGHDARRPEPQRPTTQREDPQVVRIQANIERLEAQLVTNEEALADLGVGLDGRPLDTWSDEDSDIDNSLPPLESPGVRIWTHDLYVEPGATYRYRTQVVFNNPFFGNGPALLPDQQSLAAEPLVYGQWSPWGEPISVEQDHYYFVTAASTGDDLNPMPRAQVEVFEFYYGFWRRGTANIAGGDLLVAHVDLPDPEMRPIYDLDQPPAPRTPGARPGGEAPPPPGSDAERILEAQRRRGELPGQTAGPINLPDIDALAVPGPEELPAARTDVILLDVTTLPGGQDSGLAGAGTRQVFQAVLKTGSGRIEIRNPERDRSAELFQRLRQSAEEGLRQGAPEPEPIEDEDEEPILPPPERIETPIIPPGGGGGGGGGG
jgi:hypothetical protein